MIHGKIKELFLSFVTLFYDICIWIEVDEHFDSSRQNNNKLQCHLNCCLGFKTSDLVLKI